MAYLLGGVAIKRPTSMNWTRTSQYAQNKTLDGSVTRDYFGDDKNIWVLQYRNVSNSDYSAILARYDDYIANGVRYFDSTGEAISIGTLVHVSVDTRSFNVGGTDYLGDFSLILTEA